IRQAGPEILAVARERFVSPGAAFVLADGDEFHLGRHDPAPRIVELRDGGSAAGAEGPALGGEFRGPRIVADRVLLLGPHRPARIFLYVAARADPLIAQGRQSALDGDPRIWVGVGARTVVDTRRRLAGTRMEIDLAQGNAQKRMAVAGNIDFPRGGRR